MQKLPVSPLCSHCDCTSLLIPDVLIPTHLVVLWHLLSVPQFSSVLTLSTWNVHQVPHAKGSDPRASPISDSKSKLLPDFWPTSYKSWLPLWVQQFVRMTHKAQGSTHLYYKQYSKVYRWIARWEDMLGGIWQHPNLRSSCPHGVGEPHPPGMPVCSPSQKFSEPCISGTFMEGLSCMHDWSFTQSPALSPLWRMGSGMKPPSFRTSPYSPGSLPRVSTLEQKMFLPCRKSQRV